MRRDAQARSAVIKTAGEPDPELAYGQILVAAGRRPVTAGPQFVYVAAAQGSAAAANALAGARRALNYPDGRYDGGAR